MMTKIKEILNGIEGLKGWKIVEVTKEAQELFFVKKRLDMNRSKDVHVYSVTVYVAFEEDGKQYLGESTTEIAPSMSYEAVKSQLLDTVKGASFVKNEAFTLAQPTTEVAMPLLSPLSEGKLIHWMPKFAKAVYKNDVYKAGGINSSEIFLNKVTKRIITSEGIDVSFDKYSSMIEVIADWNDGVEPVELFFLANFGGYQPDLISSKIGGLIEESRQRAHASATPNLDQINVILSGEAVRDLLRYYVGKSSARGKYEGISQFEIGQKLQGEDVQGDLLNIDMLPALEGSSRSASYDEDGVLLKPVSLIQDGQLKTLLGDTRFASYLGIPATGQINNIKVGLGSLEAAKMMEEPYLELVSFSDFQVNHLTGDFGGEIRLARYFDGKEVKAVTGGAVSSNIKDVQANMTFSKEGEQHDYYYGPKHIMFKDLKVVGSE